MKLIEKIAVFGEKSYTNKIKNNTGAGTGDTVANASTIRGIESIRTKILGKIYNKPITPTAVHYKTEKPSSIMKYKGV